jgi:hypothetical protein
MPNYSTTVRNDRMSVVNAASAGGKLAFYVSPKPATGGATTTKLAEFNLNTPAGVVAGAVWTFADPIDATVIADGTVTWARITNNVGGFVADFTVSNLAGAGEIKLTDVNLLVGMILDVTSLTITEGNP